MTIKFVSNHTFPEDNYTKELVYLEHEGKRYGFVAKMTKNNSVFWDEISVGVTEDGEKKYYKGFKFDSQFLRDDMMEYLKKRTWENKASQVPNQHHQMSFLDEPPF